MTKPARAYPEGPQRVPFDAPLEDILFLLKRDGGIIIQNFLDADTLEKCNQEITPRLDRDEKWQGDFFPGETKRAPGMTEYAPTFVKSQLMNPLFQELSNHFLTTRNTFWWGDEQKASISLPQLSSTVAFKIGPGAPAQQLHKDDYIHHNVHEEIPHWDDERDLNTRETTLGLFVAGSKTTEANGATRYIPGSHLWGNDRAPKESLAFYAELDPGDAFIMLCSCYHGGSANTTKDDYRLVYGTFMTRGYLRQEENQYLTVQQETAKKYSRDIQKVLGWTISEPFVGWVDFESPMKLLRPEEFQGGPKDLYQTG